MSLERYIAVNEQQLIIISSTVLGALNLICLYFIIDLFNYDELVSYELGGILKSTETKSVTVLLFFTCTANLILVGIVLGDRLIRRWRIYAP